MCKDQIKKNGHKRVDIESLTLLKYKEDCAPTMFVKLLTKYNHKPITIETAFKKVVNRNKMVDIDPRTILRKRCMVVAALRIDNIYIGTSIVSIQAKVDEVLITKKIKKTSAFNDLNLDNYIHEENDNDDDDNNEYDRD